jgi:hypothetical protein
MTGVFYTSGAADLCLLRRCCFTGGKAMKAPSKKKIIGLAALVLCVCLLVSGWGITHGFLREKDGVKQPMLLTVKELHLEGERICYYLYNQTHHPITLSRAPDRVEKKIDGEWKSFALFRNENTAPVTIAAFDKTWVNVSMDYSENIPGEYRLFHSATTHSGKSCSVVVDVTVNEKDVWWFGQHQSAVSKDGLPQQTEVTLTLCAQEDLQRFPTAFFVENGTDWPLTCDLFGLKVERYDSASKAFAPAAFPFSGQFAATAKIELGAYSKSERLVLGVREPTSWEILPPGVYRVSIPCCYQGDDDVFYTVAYFTV